MYTCCMTQIKTSLSEQQLVELLVEVEALSRNIDDEMFPMFAQVREDLIEDIMKKIEPAAQPVFFIYFFGGNPFNIFV